MNIRRVAVIGAVVIVGTAIVLALAGTKTAWEAPATVVALVLLVAGGNWLGGRTPRNHDVEPAPIRPVAPRAPTPAPTTTAASEVAGTEAMECPMAPWARPGHDMTGDRRPAVGEPVSSQGES